MKKNDILLNRKTLTKLLNKEYRSRILESSKKIIIEKKIGPYATYVVDAQILQRVKEYANDSKAGWGFPQLNLLCCVKSDDVVEKKFFEFNTVNHFLKDMDGDTAIDVVKCILALWAKADKSIQDFDCEKIDKELVRLDKEIEQQREKEQKINDTGKEIKEAVEPIINSVSGQSYNECSLKLKTDIEAILEKFKEEKKIFAYVVAFNRNTEETIARNEIFVDIGYKLEEGMEFVVLACHVDPNRKTENEQKKEEKQLSGTSEE